MSDVTRILESIASGDPQAASELLPLVYDELRRLAAQKLANEPAGLTLQPTALVHEAYLRLVGGAGASADAPLWAGRKHFLAAAAEAMRRILIDLARRRQTDKHGGGRQRVPLEDIEQPGESPDDVLAIDEALTRFAAEEPAKAELVKLRFFGGLTMPEAAAALDISLATAERWWAFSRVWLLSELEGDSQETTPP